MIVEGPIVTIVLAFFASFGYFNPWIVFTLSFLADMVSDSLFYAIGYYNGEWFLRRFGRYLKLNERTMAVVRKFYREHGGKSVFLAKVMTGVVPPIFIVAGFSRMNLKKFYLFAALGGLLWSGGLVALGYFFGAQFEGSFANIAQLLTRTGLVMVGLLTLFIIYKAYLHKLIERKLRLVLNNGRHLNGSPQQDGYNKDI